MIVFNSKKEQFKALKNFDKALLSVVTLFLIFGAFMVFSASYINAIMYYELNWFYFILRHIIIIIASLIGVYFIIRLFDIKTFYNAAWFLIIVTAISLYSLFIIGSIAGGAQSVISLGPISFQPLELAKVSTIIFAAAWYTNNQNNINDLVNCHGKLYGIIGVTVLLPLLMQPDLGGVIIIAAILLGLTFVSGINKIKFTGVISALAAVFAVAIIITFTLFPYQKERITEWIDPFVAYEETGEAGYQMIQSYVAIGSGGLTGKGYGNSYQKAGYLPEAHTDMIFAVIAEELGIIGVLIVIFTELLIVFLIFNIGRKSKLLFSSLVCYGVGIWILVQSFVNIGGVTGTIPLTGVTLPFISYGANAMIFLMGAIGIVLVISSKNNIERKDAKKNGK